ncbi:MAG: hypothetical protein QF362_03695 [Candidatus Woesearchaeota archaeon]|jgi:hypothetical protein|nr:hypothetical protein [Candidatus Woesearchaeota archaeon]MDP7506518.1 hypothetical protein [Candidatus Woesearchaeota archaeon]MDP7610656.1 hypothetical protein [Candidatus Woesearchaeota archaeon]|tara:strand:+ start:1731 stop:1859 length:129 start_codon:yes stop_codon:yes gene_type:complete
MKNINLGNVNNRIFGFVKQFDDIDFREIAVYEDEFLIGNLLV